VSECECLAEDIDRDQELILPELTFLAVEEWILENNNYRAETTGAERERDQESSNRGGEKEKADPEETRL